MWKVKHFKTKEALQAFMQRHHAVQIYVHNKPYSCEYKPLRKIH